MERVFQIIYNHRERKEEVDFNFAKFQARVAAIEEYGSIPSALEYAEKSLTSSPEDAWRRALIEHYLRG